MICVLLTENLEPMLDFRKIFFNVSQYYFVFIIHPLRYTLFETEEYSYHKTQYLVKIDYRYIRFQNKNQTSN